MQQNGRIYFLYLITIKGFKKLPQLTISIKNYRPAVVLPSPDHFTIAVRCCPVIFELRPHDEMNPPVIDLPYRMIFAVASKSSVYLYDTQQKMPFGCISNIHYARLTDVTWSSDGCILIVSSVDGFCTLITFESGELGAAYDKPTVFHDFGSKENEKRKRNSSDKVKSPLNDSNSTRDKNSRSTPKTNSETDKIIVEIPEIIASTETFESPEYKEKRATPIAVRREPRSTATTPSNGTTPKNSESKPSSTQKAKPISVRRQPRNILSTSIIVDKSAAQQEEEALDAWPIPIADSQIIAKSVKAEAVEKMCIDETEDMRLIYEGDSESIVLKQNDEKVYATVESSASTASETKQQTAANSNAETPDSKNKKTPRRVQLRTISTPKSKKKLSIN